MNVRFTCPHCGYQSEAEEKFIGRKVRCASCNGIFVMQREDPGSAPGSAGAEAPMGESAPPPPGPGPQEFTPAGAADGDDPFAAPQLDDPSVGSDDPFGSPGFSEPEESFPLPPITELREKPPGAGASVPAMEDDFSGPMPAAHGLEFGDASVEAPGDVTGPDADQISRVDEAYQYRFQSEDDEIDADDLADDEDEDEGDRPPPPPLPPSLDREKPELAAAPPSPGGTAPGSQPAKRGGLMAQALAEGRGESAPGPAGEASPPGVPPAATPRSGVPDAANLELPPLQEGQRYCPHCNGVIAEKAAICKHCHRDPNFIPGESVVGMPDHMQPAAQTKVTSGRQPYQVTGGQAFKTLTTPPKEVQKRSPLRILGAIIILGSLFLPWLHNLNDSWDGYTFTVEGKQHTVHRPLPEQVTAFELADVLKSRQRSIEEKPDQETVLAHAPEEEHEAIMADFQAREKAYALPELMEGKEGPIALLVGFIYVLPAIAGILLLYELAKGGTNIVIAALPVFFVASMIIYLVPGGGFTYITFGLYAAAGGSLLAIVPGKKVRVDSLKKGKR